MEFICKYCGRTCANTHTISEDQKKKTSESLKIFHKQFPKIFKTTIPKQKSKKVGCRICGKQIQLNKTGCCIECLRYSKELESFRKERGFKGGKNSAKTFTDKKRSKIEIEFFEMVKSLFPDSLSNPKMFGPNNEWDSDIVIPSLKLAIEWNGIWHYEDIMSQLKMTQNRDKIKAQEINRKGFTLYVIDGRCKKYERQEKLNEEFQKLVAFIKTL